MSPRPSRNAAVFSCWKLDPGKVVVQPSPDCRSLLTGHLPICLPVYLFIFFAAACFASCSLASLHSVSPFSSPFHCAARSSCFFPYFSCVARSPRSRFCLSAFPCADLGRLLIIDGQVDGSARTAALAAGRPARSLRSVRLGIGFAHQIVWVFRLLSIEF